MLYSAFINLVKYAIDYRVEYFLNINYASQRYLKRNDCDMAIIVLIDKCSILSSNVAEVMLSYSPLENKPLNEIIENK